MTFYERIMQMAHGYGYRTASQFFKACEIYNKVDKDRFKNDDEVTEEMLEAMAKVLQCSKGNLNEMRREALAKELANNGKRFPDMPADRPLSERELQEFKAADRKKREPSEAQRAQGKRLAEMQRQKREQARLEREQAEQQQQQPAQEEAAHIQEADTPAPAVEAPIEPPAPQPVEELPELIKEAVDKGLIEDPRDDIKKMKQLDDELEAKLDAVEERVTVQHISYFDVLRSNAEASVQAVYEKMVKEKMLEAVMSDMDAVADDWKEHRNLEAAAHMCEVSSMYLNLSAEAKND